MTEHWEVHAKQFDGIYIGGVRGIGYFLFIYFLVRVVFLLCSFINGKAT